MFFYHLAKWLVPLIVTLLLLPSLSYAAEPRIALSAFTTTANKHKPSNTIQQLNNDIKKIYFFTDIRDFQGKTLTHQWSYNGWVVQSIPFVISGRRWRVSSNKSLKPRGKGTWIVKVIDEAGKVIHKGSISYNKQSAQSVTIKPNQDINQKEVKAAKKNAPSIPASTEKSSPKTEKKDQKDSKKSSDNDNTAKQAVSQKKVTPANTESPRKVASTTENSKPTKTPSSSPNTSDVENITTSVDNSSQQPSSVETQQDDTNSSTNIGDCEDEDEDIGTGKQQVTDE